MASKDRANMIYEMCEVGFYLDDLRLFLDTHPNDCQALAMYNEYEMKNKVLADEYAVAYGPMDYSDMNNANTWKWVAYPWPWEGVC
jgi:spore coat protein JB